MEAVTIKVPGAFGCYLDGSGVMQGDPWSDDPAEEEGAEKLRAAWRSANAVRSGRGHYYPVVLDNLHSLVILANYADMAVEINTQSYNDNDSSELAAARKVISRIVAAVGDKLVYSGLSWKLAE